MFFTTSYQTKSSQSRVRIPCGWLLRLRESSLKKQKSISVMLSMTQVLLTIKFFVTLPQSTKVPLKRPNLITFFHLGESLNESAITPKKYCSILHSFLHKRKMPKNPRIRHNNMFLTDTLVKANTFNFFLQSNVP